MISSICVCRNLFFQIVGMSHLKSLCQRFTTKIYHLVCLLCVVNRVFKKLANNRFVNHLEKCGLFFQYKDLIDLILVKLQHLIYLRLLIELGMLVFFTILSLIEFWINYFPLVFSQV